VTATDASQGDVVQKHPYPGSDPTVTPDLGGKLRLPGLSAGDACPLLLSILRSPHGET